VIRTLLLFLPLAACAQRFDLLIANGRILDGAGNPWFYADIGIRGDTITAIGILKNAQAATRIDVAGLTVAPGFIDIHSHGRRGASARRSAAKPDGTKPCWIRRRW